LLNGQTSAPIANYWAISVIQIPSQNTEGGRNMLFKGYSYSISNFRVRVAFINFVWIVLSNAAIVLNSDPLFIEIFVEGVGFLRPRYLYFLSLQFFYRDDPIQSCFPCAQLYCSHFQFCSCFFQNTEKLCD